MRRFVVLGALAACALGGLSLASAAVRDAPPGASALCSDGTYSFSQTHSGTCSHHGGVAQWLTSAAPTTTAAPSVAPPPGVTARCKDGSYSFSQHHSGTCSHHGGVAVWLDGSTSTTGAVPVTATSSGSPPLDVGKTVLLVPRTKQSGCRVGSLPDRRCSPGAYYSKLTRAVICSSGFHTSSIRNVPDSERHQVEVEYGLAAKPYGSTLEIDHIVSLELGGSNDAANLYPEEATFSDRSPGFHVKDKLENAVHKAVCAGTISLRSAQQQIASNWEKLYKKLYDVAPTG